MGTMRTEPPETSHLEVTVNESGKELRFRAIVEVVSVKEPGQMRDRIGSVEARSAAEALRKAASIAESYQEYDETPAEDWREYSDDLDDKER